MVKLPSAGVRKATICMIQEPDGRDRSSCRITSRGRDHLVFGNIAVRHGQKTAGETATRPASQGLEPDLLRISDPLRWS